MPYSQGDIILVPFDYADKSVEKKRPALVISQRPNSFNDYILVQITSKIRNEQNSVVITSEDVVGDLLKTSEVRVDRVFTANYTRIIKKLCAVKPRVLGDILIKYKAQF